MDFKKLISEASEPHTQSEIARATGGSDAALTEKRQKFTATAGRLSASGKIPNENPIPAPYRKETAEGAAKRREIAAVPTDAELKENKYKFIPWEFLPKGPLPEDNAMAFRMWWYFRRIPVLDIYNKAMGSDLSYVDIAVEIAKSNAEGGYGIEFLEKLALERPELFSGDVPSKIKKTNVDGSVEAWFALSDADKVRCYEFARDEITNWYSGKPTLPQTVLTYMKAMKKGLDKIEDMKSGKTLGHSGRSLAATAVSMKAAEAGGSRVTAQATGAVKYQDDKGAVDGETGKERGMRRSMSSFKRIVGDDQDAMLGDISKEMGVSPQRVKRYWDMMRGGMDSATMADLRNFTWAVKAIEDKKKTDPGAAQMMREALKGVIRDKKSIPFETIAWFQREAPVGERAGRMTGVPNVDGMATMIGELLRKGWGYMPAADTDESGVRVSNKLYPWFISRMQEWGPIVEVYVESLMRALYAEMMQRVGDEFEAMAADGNDSVYDIDSEIGKKMRQKAVESSVSKTLKANDLAGAGDIENGIADSIREGVYAALLEDSVEIPTRNRLAIENKLMNMLRGDLKRDDNGKLANMGQMQKVVSNAISELDGEAIDALRSAIVDVAGKELSKGLLYNLLYKAVSEKKAVKKESFAPGRRFLNM